MITQKRWIDILGKYPEGCSVLGKEIVYRYGISGEYKTLWTFKDNKRASEVYEIWRKEILYYNNH